MRADLHVHSNASDGSDSAAEVMRRAAQAGLDVVALTDHDTVAGHAQARQAPRQPHLRRKTATATRTGPPDQVAQDRSGPPTSQDYVLLVQ